MVVGVSERASFPPRFDIGDVIEVATGLGEGDRSYYRVRYVEPFFIRHDTGTITNGQQVSFKLSEMEVNKDEIAQVRFRLDKDGFTVYMNLPEAVAKFTTKNAVTGFDKFIADNYPEMTEVWYAGDQVPRITVANQSGADDSVELRIIGYRYVLERIPGRPPKVDGVVYVQAVPSPGRPGA